MFEFIFENIIYVRIKKKINHSRSVGIKRINKILININEYFINGLLIVFSGI